MGGLYEISLLSMVVVRGLGKAVATGTSAITIFVLGSISVGYAVHGILLKFPRKNQSKTRDNSSVASNLTHTNENDEIGNTNPVMEKAKKSAQNIYNLTHLGTEAVSAEVI